VGTKKPASPWTIGTSQPMHVDPTGVASAFPEMHTPARQDCPNHLMLIAVG
jgi:hypothetical protein